MTDLRNVTIESISGSAADAFTRLRTSPPFTIFDSKQLNDNLPLLWDDAETSGSGTSSSHSVNTASTTISVGATTAGTRVRQTFRRFNYQPGKSQLVFLTGTIGSGGTGLTQRIGIFDDDNGLFFNIEEGTVKVTRRTKTSGAVVDNDTAQSSWSVDKMDGTGTSGITLDFTKEQIFVIDFEWLGVGTVEFGFVVDKKLYTAHQIHTANSGTAVWASTPNLPLRYEISNDGTGAAASVEQVCGTVISEGGNNPSGVTRYKSTGATNIKCNTADTAYAIIGLKLQSAKAGTTIDIQSISVLCETNDDFEWFLVFNPTLGSALSYSNLTNSAVQVAVGEASNPSTSTVTGGTIVAGGYGAATVPSDIPIDNSLKLGKAIDGTLDEYVLAVRPLTSNAEVQGSITWKEE